MDLPVNPPTTEERLAQAALAFGALPYELAMLIFLSTTGSSAGHIAQTLRINLAEVSKLRMQVARSFAKEMKRTKHRGTEGTP